MTDNDYNAMMLQEAEENDEDNLEWSFELQKQNGEAKTVTVNATALFRPGERRSGDVDLLVTEAELAAAGDHGGNPAKPANADVARRAIQRIEDEGLEPAWRVVGGGKFP